jgi:gliding motility-associated-like protein
MKKLIFIISFLIALQSFAQGEANFWYFGENAGLDFNGSTPTSITGGLNTIEGCASISDKDGKLLFYTDGTKVFNNTHIQMPNGFGLNGNPSSSQSAIIVPKPGSNTIYYIFTVEDQNGDGRGMQYSEVDITLNDVVSKNTPLINNTSEKIAAVKSRDCNYWVLTYKLGRFYVYKIDSNGVNGTPIVGNNGFFLNQDGRGYLKVSPDGKQIAIAHQGDAKLLVYDFNDTNGTISNEVEIPLLIPNNKPYGIEFSPSGKKLYCTASNDYWNTNFSIWNNPNNHTSTLYQFDLESADITSPNARKIIDQRQLYRGALQLAPNGKIYRALSSTYNIGINKLGVINYPEELGTNCDYNHSGIDLGTNLSTQGLPPFISSFLLPIEITDIQTNTLITNTTISLCVGSNFEMKAESIDGSPIYTWEHTANDGSTTTFNGQSLPLTNVSLSDAGIYKLNVETQDNCSNVLKIYEGTVTIIVNENPVVISNIIYEQCDFDSNSVDGITTFNLTTKEAELTNGITNLEVTFYEQTDISISNPINKLAYINSSGPSHSLIVEVENILTGCSSLGIIDLLVLPTSLETYNDVYVCENDVYETDSNALKSEGNGYGTFNFDEISTSIESIFPLPVLIEFYNNSDDALKQINKITGIQNLQPQEIFVRVENQATKSCLGGGTFNLKINPLPQPTGEIEEQLLCVNNPIDIPQERSNILNGESDITTDTYQWYFNNSIISGATSSTLEATKEGVYKVEATRINQNNLTNLLDDTMCVGFNTFKVIESNFAVITDNDITIIDDSLNNSITINSTNLGIGDYEFAIDEIYGIYQDNPYFENVEAGIHTIYIRDKNQCGTTQIDVAIIGFPKFFTPNNDGFNDTWKVLGVNENFYTSSNIYIFNRYGKLITQINPKGEGWNGMFNGEYLPATDYWFSVELIDNNGNIRVRKGHFSLIRR